jgi:hypothetical protein
MKKTLFSMAAASVMLAGAAMAADMTTTSSSTWTNEEGTTLQQYSTTKHYDSVNDPSMHVIVGSSLPSSVTMYPLPDTMRVPSAQNYSYSIINDHPVVVERSTRKVVHTWD